MKFNIELQSHETEVLIAVKSHHQNKDIVKSMVIVQIFRMLQSVKKSTEA